VSELLPKTLADHYDHIWRCDCSDIHYLTLTWDDEDPTWRYLAVADGWGGRSVKERIKGAWKLLRGHYHTGCEILLNDETVADVLAVLSAHAGERS